MSGQLPLADQERRVDQQLSAHAKLGQRLASRQRSLTLGVLVLSVLATALAFAGEGHDFSLLGLNASLPTWAGVLSTLVFVLALIDLQVHWHTDAGAHADAVRRLSTLKGRYSLLTDPGRPASEDQDTTAEYWRVMGSLPQIPERQFLAAKAAHQRKIALSRLLDDGAAGAPLPLLRLKLRLVGVAALWRAKVEWKVPAARSRARIEAGQTQPVAGAVQADGQDAGSQCVEVAKRSEQRQGWRPWRR